MAFFLYLLVYKAFTIKFLLFTIPPMDDKISKLKTARNEEKAIVDEIIEDLKKKVGELRDLGYGDRVSEIIGKNKGGRPPKLKNKTPDKKSE